MDFMQTDVYKCRLCNGNEVKKISEGKGETSHLRSVDFKITDSRYGFVASIYVCADCGFEQCLDMPDTKEFYKDLEDPEYETTRGARMLQSKMILDAVIRISGEKPAGSRLLDVGAGSGILLEAASQIGFRAEGVEPSDWLRTVAANHGCPIRADGIPHPQIKGPYDLVTLIDVIEHVSNPFELVSDSVDLLKPGGKIVIVTPDVKSLAATVMRSRWWHYRIAHVGYFSQKTLEFVCSRLNLRVISISRPKWVFSLAYIRERLERYIPKYLLPAEKSWMHRITIGLNLRDSLMIVAERQ